MFNNVMLRAAVNAQMAKEAVVERMTDERGEPNLIFVLAASVIVLVILFALYTSIIEPRLDEAQACSDAIGNLVDAVDDGKAACK